MPNAISGLRRLHMAAAGSKCRTRIAPFRGVGPGGRHKWKRGGLGPPRSLYPGL